VPAILTAAPAEPEAPLTWREIGARAILWGALLAFLAIFLGCLWAGCIIYEDSQHGVGRRAGVNAYLFTGLVKNAVSKALLPIVAWRSSESSTQRIKAQFLFTIASSGIGAPALISM